MVAVFFSYTAVVLAIWGLLSHTEFATTHHTN